jgi:hypothetical protein
VWNLSTAGHALHSFRMQAAKEDSGLGIVE